MWGTVQHGHLVAAEVYHKVRCALQSRAPAELMEIGHLDCDSERHCMLGQETCAKGGFVPLACSLWQDTESKPPYAGIASDSTAAVNKPADKLNEGQKGHEEGQGSLPQEFSLKQRSMNMTDVGSTQAGEASWPASRMLCQQTASLVSCMAVSTQHESACGRVTSFLHHLLYVLHCFKVAYVLTLKAASVCARAGIF